MGSSSSCADTLFTTRTNCSSARAGFCFARDKMTIIDGNLGFLKRFVVVVSDELVKRVGWEGEVTSFPLWFTPGLKHICSQCLSRPKRVALAPLGVYFKLWSMGGNTVLGGIFQASWKSYCCYSSLHRY